MRKINTKLKTEAGERVNSLAVPRAVSWGLSEAGQTRAESGEGKEDQDSIVMDIKAVNFRRSTVYMSCSPRRAFQEGVMATSG